MAGNIKKGPDSSKVTLKIKVDERGVFNIEQDGTQTVIEELQVQIGRFSFNVRLTAASDTGEVDSGLATIPGAYGKPDIQCSREALQVIEGWIIKRHTSHGQDWVPTSRLEKCILTYLFDHARNGRKVSFEEIESETFYYVNTVKSNLGDLERITSFSNYKIERSTDRHGQMFLSLVKGK